MNPPDRREALVTPDQRRLPSCQRDFVKLPQPPQFDEIDHLVADPLIERHANRRSDKATNRLLSILDELDGGEG